MLGKVLTFDRRTGYGFIRIDNAGPDDPDVFLHVSVLPPNLKDVLKSGDRVEFESEESGEKRFKATKVKLLDGSSHPPAYVREDRVVSPVEFGMAIAPALTIVSDRAVRSKLSSSLLSVAIEHGWVVD